MNGKAIDYSFNEERFLRKHETTPRAALTKLFNAQFNRDISQNNIKAKCKRMGLKTGRTGCFAKGHVPANKGRKGWCAPGCEKGWFKSGAIPPNKKPIGHERICPKDGYVLINIDEPNPHTGHANRYVHKHRYLWEKINGPIPDGLCLKSKDGNPQNTDPENWELISRGVLVRLNKEGLYKLAPPDLRPAVITAAKIVEKVARLSEGHK